MTIRPTTDLAACASSTFPHSAGAALGAGPVGSQCTLLPVANDSPQALARGVYSSDALLNPLLTLLAHALRARYVGLSTPQSTPSEMWTVLASVGARNEIPNFQRTISVGESVVARLEMIVEIEHQGAALVDVIAPLIGALVSWQNDTVPSHTRDVVAPDRRLRAAATVWRLTGRQTEVLSLLVTGMANKTIADRLACAEATVEIHVTAIFRAASVTSRAALIAGFWCSPDLKINS